MQPTQTQTPLTFRRLAQRIRVPAGFVLAPLLMLAAQPTPRSLFIGAALSIVGLMIRAWASGYLKKNQELTTTGPYTYTRNPLYFGTFIMATGIATSTNAWWFVGLFMALYLLIYIPVMQAEAETLANLFPSQYASYSQRVPMFVPRLTPYRDKPNVASSTGERRFAFSQYVKHREYQAAFGLLVVYAIIITKFFLLK